VFVLGRLGNYSYFDFDFSSGCDNPLGMTSKCITDSQITANTFLSSANGPEHARLNLVLGGGGWAGSAPGDYLQVVKIITGLPVVAQS
jgi:hypothetical protein